MLKQVTRDHLRAALTNSSAFREIQEILNFVDGPGDRFYVDSGDGDDSNNGTDWDSPLATLDAAVAKCTANNGDLIICKPGHADTLSADSAVDLDVAGITVLGLGHGAARPTFTFDTAVTADFKLAAASVKIINLLFVSGIDALTGPIEVGAADCAIIDCEYRDDDSNNYETTDVVTVLTAGHRLLIDGFKFIHDGGSGGTQQQSVINLVSADYAEIRNCHIVCDGAAGCIEDATASLQINIHHNTLESTHANDVAITLAAASTGFVQHNNLRIATDGQVTWISADNDCQLFENYGVNADAEAGGLIGTVST